MFELPVMKIVPVIVFWKPNFSFFLKEKYQKLNKCWKKASASFSMAVCMPAARSIAIVWADSTVSCFADDTRILLGIKDEEGTQMLQNDLHKLYKWADTNNMKFNVNRFELLRYGKEQEIKSATTYKLYDHSNIDDKE